MNEVTFVAKLSNFTALRFKEAHTLGNPAIIAQGNIEEAQRDSSGRVKRCDMRLATAGNRKLLSGEMKRPEVPEGRDPRNDRLIADARNKAVGRGLPLYFTCNMAWVVLWQVSLHSGVPDREIGEFQLAPINKSSEVEAYIEDIQREWSRFLDEVERHLTALESALPPPTSADVVRLQSAIHAAASEALLRAERYLSGNPSELERARQETIGTFGYPFALDPSFRAEFRQELGQILRLSIFVVAQKLILHRVLAETGKRLRAPFTLDGIEVPKSSTDPVAIRMIFDRAVNQAQLRSRDFETAFLATPNEWLVFIEPISQEEVSECKVGEAWLTVLSAINDASWSAISHNLVGFLYEAIVDPDYRHALGQHYTQENVVDLLTGFAVRERTDVIIDPAAGGGSFLISAYSRKRNLGADHSDALSEIWGSELSSFAAELSTVTLATADPSAPSAYPRVLLKDFFEIRPGMRTPLEIPGDTGPLRVPRQFDAVIGNPPYISYRYQTNQANVLQALQSLPREIAVT